MICIRFTQNTETNKAEKLSLVESFFCWLEPGRDPNHTTVGSGKGAECQHGVLSGEAGSEASLLARKGERNALQGFRATIERTEFESRRAPTRQKNRPLVFKEQKLSIEYDYVIVDTINKLGLQ